MRRSQIYSISFLTMMASAAACEAQAQSNDMLFAQTTPSTTSPGTAGAVPGTTSAPSTQTPSATTMPYQQGSSPSYSSSAPTTYVPPAPAYQSTVPAGTATTSPTAGVPATSLPVCPASPIGAAPTTTVPGSTGCPQ